MKPKHSRILMVALVGSLSLHVAVIVKYRIPGRFWAPAEIETPEIPLSNQYREYPPPELRFSPVDTSAAELAAWRDRARTALESRLGVARPTAVPSVRLVRSERVGELTRETIVLTADDGVEIPGFLFVPPNSSPGPAVAVIPPWSVGIVGSAGLIEDSQHAMALRIAELGYVVLVLEHRGMGYLQRLGPPGEEMGMGSQIASLVMHGESLPGRLVADVTSGLNYLETRPEVDESRLGAVGMSLGGKIAIYLTALDQRIVAAVASGSVMTYRANFRFSRHGPEDAIPGLAGLLDLGDVMGIVSPRPMLVHWGADDNDRVGRSAAYNESSMEAFGVAMEVYSAAGAANRLSYHVSEGMGHEFDLEPVRTFLAEHLPLD